MHNACREMEALLLEQVSDRLRAQLPALVARIVEEHFRGPDARQLNEPMDKSYSPRDIESRLYAPGKPPAGSRRPAPARPTAS